MSARATSFYYSFLALPETKRNAIVAVWDFCRAVDDAVDEAPEGEAPGALRRWRLDLERLYEGRTPETAQGRQLLPYLSAFKLPREAFDDLIEGVTMDLDGRRYETFEALRQYCLRVASAVGLICIEIFGYRDARARDYATHLGIALQLTNIVRDVAADVRRGRLYIPLEDLSRFGVSEQDLASGTLDNRVRSLLAHQCDRAREFYRLAESALPRSDERALVAARIMSAIYLDLLTSIERRGYDVFNGTIRVGRGRQALIAGWTWLKVMVR